MQVDPYGRGDRAQYARRYLIIYARRYLITKLGVTFASVDGAEDVFALKTVEYMVLEWQHIYFNC